MKNVRKKLTKFITTDRLILLLRNSNAINKMIDYGLKVLNNELNLTKSLFEIRQGEAKELLSKQIKELKIAINSIEKYKEIDSKLEKHF